MDDKRRHELERVLEETLHDGIMNEREPNANEEARERISAPYEYRIRAERDPIAEETKIIRSMAKEPDGKYDDYAKS
ncbi:hypothetical protein FE782_19950 [Paenibacillus antri]|uniref:Uncharacterized protein n=1 Tax=Paenibacillus antri TaxID=2582848 RepID=A0A5R9G8F1_9BACL|nr:hypothetical protein [Paenibacillus antri]TLS50636.1 hypothetical protein FE782_19950 [Paenibacillus antri]